MKKYKAAPVYQKPGKTNINHLWGKSGVYLLFRPGASRPCYIGMSGANLYKTITRHFQAWDQKERVRVTYSQSAGIRIRAVLCTPAQAARLERALILKLKPVDNPDKLEAYAPSAQEVKAYTDWMNETEEPLPF